MGKRRRRRRRRRKGSEAEKKDINENCTWCLPIPMPKLI